MDTPRILAFAGSTRSASYNKQLVKIAAGGAEKAGAEVSIVDLRDYPLPLYDGDLEAEEGLPENANRLKTLFVDHNGLLIACPEYNSSLPAVLKNTIDWVSRPEPGETPLNAFSGKIAAIMSASPGGIGGLRALIHLRAILGNIHVTVLPDQAAIPQAHEAFTEEGSLRDPKRREKVENLGITLSRIIAKLTT